MPFLGKNMKEKYKITRLGNIAEFIFVNQQIKCVKEMRGIIYHHHHIR
jgi:hypothetical protein